MAPETIMLIAAFIFLFAVWRRERRAHLRERALWAEYIDRQRRCREAWQIVRARQTQAGRMN